MSQTHKPLVYGEGQGFDIETESGPVILQTYPDIYLNEFHTKPHFNWVIEGVHLSVVSILKRPMPTDSPTVQVHHALSTSGEKTEKFTLEIDKTDARLENTIKASLVQKLKARGHQIKCFVQEDGYFTDQLVTLEKAHPQVFRFFFENLINFSSKEKQ